MPRRRRRRRRALVLLLILAALLLWWCGRSPPLVLGTFNIRMFPDQGVKFDAVAAEIAALGADAFTVQEIRDPRAFDKLLRRVNDLTGRSYEAKLSPYCRKLKDSDVRLNLGVVYDVARVELLEHRPLSPGDRCPQGQPPAALSLLRPHGGPPLGLVSVHFKAGGGDDHFALRRREWGWLTATLRHLEAELAAPVVVAGDFNSTGWLDSKHRERTFIEGQLAIHRLQLPTADLACSEYWLPPNHSRYEVSLLDHIVAPDSLRFARAEVLGMCAALACAPQTAAPDRFHTVSDHCPVRVELRR
jgi:endonuclease/exonuclease/phosphatase family metal-dependent hydrolase